MSETNIAEQIILAEYNTMMNDNWQINYLNHLAPAVTVVPGMGCGEGDDGYGCTPAYLCRTCIDLLIESSIDL